MSLDLKKQKSRLEAKKAELEESIGALTQAYPEPVDAIEANDGPHDQEDIATDFVETVNERSVQFNEQALLTQVNAALQRLENGTYGLCQTCGEPIPERRLEAIPWADRDVRCEEALEAHYSSREEVYGEPQTF